MTKETLQDVNGKPSTTREQLNKYSKWILLFDAIVILLAIVLNNDIPTNAASVLIWLNSIFYGTTYGKMGIEHLKKKND